MRVHKGTALVAGVAVLALALAACSSSGGKKSGSSGAPSSGGSSSSNSSGGTSSSLSGSGAFADCNKNVNTCNTGTAKKGGTITYVLEKTIAGWNVNTSNSGTFEDAEVEDGIYPPVYNAGPDFKPFLNTDLMTSATSTTTGGVQTIVYKINPKAVWSDGQPINADDFIYEADALNPATCKNCDQASTAGYSSIKTISGSDGGKTVTVVMAKPFVDWQAMFGNLVPAHIAAQHGGTTGEAQISKSWAWLDANRPTVSGGPMLISAYSKDISITEVPNPKYYGATKSQVDSVIFKIILDQTQEPPALQNHEVDAIYPQPTQDLVNATKNLPGIQTNLGLGLQWEHLDLNTKNKFLSDVKLRTAIFTAVDVEGMIKRTVGLFAPQIKPLGNHMYVPGQAGYVDNVTATGQGSGDIAKAKQELTAAGYTGVGSSLKTPSGQTVKLGCTYSQGNTIRAQECTLIQNSLKQLGINVSLATTPDLGGVLYKEQFDMIVYAWVNTPFVAAGAQQIFTKAGGSLYSQLYDPAMEAFIDQAVASSNPADVAKLLNEADVKLTADAAVLPLYQKPSYLAADTNVVNLRNNATSVGPPYNIAAWGLKS